MWCFTIYSILCVFKSASLIACNMGSLCWAGIAEICSIRLSQYLQPWHLSWLCIFSWGHCFWICISPRETTTGTPLSLRWNPENAIWSVSVTLSVANKQKKKLLSFSKCLSGLPTWPVGDSVLGYHLICIYVARSELTMHFQWSKRGLRLCLLSLCNSPQRLKKSPVQQ